MSANINPNAALKVRVNEKESWRRIPLHRLMKEYDNSECNEIDRSENAYNINVSFEKLCKYAVLYSDLGSGNLCNFEFQLTYTDEEGDQVQISTDEELIDAMLWKQECSDVLHILASVKAKARASDPTISPEDGQSYKSKPVLDLVDVDASLPNNKVSTSQIEEKAALAIEPENKIENEEIESQQSTKARISRRPQRQRRHCRNRRYKHQKNALPPVKAAVDTVLNFVNDTVDTITAGLSPYASTHYTQTVFDPNFVHARHTCDGCSSPIIGYRYHATNIPDFDLCLPCKSKCILPDISFIQAQDGAINMAPSPQHEGVDPNFVHSRHTCDGCGISPIVGYRWHSTNIANYDVCDGCKTKNVCTDITFQLQQIEADRAYPRSNPIPSANKARNNEDECLSSDLQRALQLSFEECKTSEEKCDEGHNDAATEAKSPTTTDDEPLVLSASEALEFLVPSANEMFGENKNKSTPKIIENDSFSETGTQTDIALLSSTEDKYAQTDEEKIVTEDEDDDIEDSFTSVEKDPKFTSDDVDMEELSEKERVESKDTT